MRAAVASVGRRFRKACGFQSLDSTAKQLSQTEMHRYVNRQTSLPAAERPGCEHGDCGGVRHVRRDAEGAIEHAQRLAYCHLRSGILPGQKRFVVFTRIRFRN